MMIIIYYLFSILPQLLLIFLVLTLILMLFLYLYQDHLFFQPVVPGKDRSIRFNEENYRSPKERNIFHDDATIMTQDNVKLFGWLLRNKDSKNLPTLIYFHGHTGNIGNQMDVLTSFISDLRVNILIVDYRGFGDSEGVSSEAGIYLDSEAILKYALQNAFINNDKIFLFGRSLGNCLCLHLATKYPHYIQGIIMENAFGNACMIIDYYFPIFKYFNFLKRNKFPNTEFIKKLVRPVLFIVGENDTLIPPYHTSLLYSQVPLNVYKELLKVPEAGHRNCPYIGGKAYLDSITEFITKCSKKYQIRVVRTIFDDVSEPDKRVHVYEKQISFCKE